MSDDFLPGTIRLTSGVRVALVGLTWAPQVGGATDGFSAGADRWDDTRTPDKFDAAYREAWERTERRRARIHAEVAVDVMQARMQAQVVTLDAEAVKAALAEATAVPEPAPPVEIKVGQVWREHDVGPESWVVTSYDRETGVVSLLGTGPRHARVVQSESLGERFDLATEPAPTPDADDYRDPADLPPVGIPVQVRIRHAMQGEAIGEGWWTGTGWRIQLDVRRCRPTQAADNMLVDASLVLGWRRLEAGR